MKNLDSGEKKFIRAVGARIRELRHAHHLEVEDVASKTRRTPVWLSELEEGNHDPTIEDLYFIARALGTYPDELVSVDVL